MWAALEAASARPDVTVTIYLDAVKGTPEAVAKHMPKATVYRTLTLHGGDRPLVSHAKFIIVDRAVMFMTSANFSYSAGNTNIELGLLVHEAMLATSIESVMRSKHGVLYERVLPG
jgi:phosphatidylserine/phosphatidylglycerophosphate/cardiolipin synthase-like enzyme